MNPQATITAIDSPSKYWYTATTSYGQQSKGVRLYGTGSKFRVGESVDVFQCGEEYGYAEIPLQYKSQLTIPDAMKAEVARQAPASVALAYIAKLAGNNKVYYVPGTVVSIIDTLYMMVSSTLSTSPLRLMCVINTSAFYVGARVLIMAHPLKTPQVIGWWNCLPEEEPEDKPDWWTEDDEEWWDNGDFSDIGLHRNKKYAIAMGRIPFSANFDIALIDEDFNWIKSNRFNHRDPASNSCFVTVLPTTKEEEYYYVSLMMGINFGAILERYWLKIHKVTFVMTEIAESQFPPHPGIPYSTTENDLLWWPNSGGYIASVSQDGTTWYDAFYTGPTNDYWFPLHKWHYRTDIFPGS